MKVTLFTLVLFAYLGSVQASETRFLNVMNEITASVMQPATFEVRGHTGRNRVGGYAGNGRARKEIEKCT